MALIDQGQKARNLMLTVLCIQLIGLSLISAQPTGIKCTAVDGAPGCVCDHPNGSGRIDLRPTAEIVAVDM